MKLILQTTIVLVLISCNIYAQDYIFSQSYASRLYQNPAFTGNTNLISGTILQRIQWPYENTMMSTSCLIVDFVPPIKNSGLALIGISGYDVVTNEYINRLSLSYSYAIQINEDYLVKGGLQGIAVRLISINKL